MTWIDLARKSHNETLFDFRGCYKERHNKDCHLTLIIKSLHFQCFFLCHFAIHKLKESPVWNKTNKAKSFMKPRQ